MEPQVVKQVSCWVWDVTYIGVEVTLRLPSLGSILLPCLGFSVMLTGEMYEVIQLIFQPVQVWKPRPGCGSQGT